MLSSSDWSRATDGEQRGTTMYENVPTGKSSHLFNISWSSLLEVQMLPDESVLCLSSVSSGERQQVLGALERLQTKLAQKEEWTHSEIMGNLRETLQSPLFTHILTLQHSIKQLRNQVRSYKHLRKTRVFRSQVDSSKFRCECPQDTLKTD